MPSVGFEGAWGQQAMADQIRQRIMDALAQKKTEHEMSVEDQRLALEKQRYDQEAQDRALLRSQQGQAFNETLAEKTGANLGAGPSIISPELAKRFANTSLAPLVTPDKTLPSTSLAGAAPMVGDATPDVAPTITANAPQLTGQLRFAGLPKINEAEQQKVLRGQLLADTSLTPQQRVEMQAESVGLKAPTREPHGEAVVRTDPTRKVVQRLVNGQWQDVTGDVPAGAHFLPEPQRKDTSAAGANRMDKSYQYTNTQLMGLAKPLEDQAERIGRLRATIAQNSPQADALIAPELLTAMAGGQGSGLRMNEAEISRIVGGRNKWQDLKSRLEAWQLDPSQPFQVTPEQRKQMRDLVNAIAERGQSRLALIDDANQKLIDAPDVETQRRIVADVRKALGAETLGGGRTNNDGAGAAPPKRIRYGMDGKPLP